MPMWLCFRVIPGLTSLDCFYFQENILMNIWATEKNKTEKDHLNQFKLVQYEFMSRKVSNFQLEVDD